MILTKRFLRRRTSYRTKIKPNLMSLQVMVSHNSLLYVYTFLREGLKFTWEPADEIEEQFLPPCVILNTGTEWFVEADQDAVLDLDLIGLIVGALVRYLA